MAATAASSRAPAAVRLPRFTSVDALRACAALLVLLSHTSPLPGPLVVLKPIAAFGWSGVGLFLVISGFSIHFRWAASDVPHHEFTPKRFFERRFFRLYPTYLAAVMATALLLLALGRPLDQPVPWVFAAGDLPRGVLALSTIVLVPANLIPVALVAVAWSLGLEIQLYCVYAALIRRLRGIGILKVVAITLFGALAFRLLSEVVTSSMPVGQFFPGGGSTQLSRLLYAQLPSRAFEWFLGVLAAEAFFGRVPLPRWTRSPLAAAAFLVTAALLYRVPLGVAYLNGHFFRASDVLLDPLIGVGYFLLLQSVVSREGSIATGRVSRAVFGALAFIGIFSYSVYLMHQILLSVGDRLLADAHVAAPASTLIVWVFVLVGAWLFHRAVERPFITGAGDRWILARLSRLRRRHD